MFKYIFYIYLLTAPVFALAEQQEEPGLITRVHQNWFELSTATRTAFWAALMLQAGYLQDSNSPDWVRKQFCLPIVEQVLKGVLQGGAQYLLSYLTDSQTSEILGIMLMILDHQTREIDSQILNAFTSLLHAKTGTFFLPILLHSLYELVAKELC